LIQLYASANRIEDAVKLANEVAARSPQDAEVRRLLGQIYQGYAYDRRGGFNRESAANAIAEFEKALAIEPDDLETLQSIGGLKLDMGDAAAAEKHFLHALEIAPADPQALAGLARIYVASGETEKAIAALEQVVQSEGGNRRYLEPLARAYEEVHADVVVHLRAAPAVERAVRHVARERVAHVDGFPALVAQAS
jgi:Flp pilus assembly protein TadD